MSLERFRLDGRVALVTGGSKGLGKAMALALAGAGADVVITSRHLDESEAAAESIRSVTGRRALAVQADVADRPQVDDMVARALAEFGKIDILVNNAGINIRRPVVELSDDDWHAVIDTNLHGTLYCTRAVGKGMVAQQYGRVINIASTLGSVAIAHRAAYASSKGAVIQLTKVLALEWAPSNITVNALCPGPFLTEINQPILSNPEAYQFFISKVPLGRFADPDELGGAAIFLASDASSFVTGTTLYVDGGWTAQ
ncbi:MAG: glucose 1-dehydrogenase [Candidatus Latescibacteria bacterium]|nr:glucose 1-dehydrogenase [Candidatus Latescibacterota bacterium]